MSALTHGPEEPAVYRQWLLIATICMGTILAPLNSTMIALALPTIRDEFEVSHAGVAWLAMTYLIAMVVMQPVGGRLGDELGRARVFRVGLVLFLLASVAATLAPTFPMLVFIRTVQAVIGAAIIPCGVAILRDSVPPTALGRVTGIISSASSVVAALSPVLGAGILAVSSWRVIFLASVPCVALGLAGFLLLGYRDPPRTAPRARFDAIGALNLAAILALGTLLASAVSGDGSDTVVVALAVAFVSCTGAFVLGQVRTVTPVAEWRLFGNRSFTGAGVHVLCNNLVMYTLTVMTPFYIKELRDGSSLTAGWLLLAMSGMMALAAPIGGRISDSAGRRLPMVYGGLLMTAPTAALLLVLDAETPTVLIGVIVAAIGFGLGLGLGAAAAAAIETAPPRLSGSAAGTNFMMRWLGAVIGTATLGAVLTSGGDTPPLGAFTVIVAVMLGAGVVATAAGFLVEGPGGRRAAVWPLAADPAVSSDEPVR